MKFRVLLLIIPSLLIPCFPALCQSDKKGSKDANENNSTSFSDRIFIGGNIGMQFGTFTFINASPVIGYRFTDNFSAGPGITYQYFNYNGNSFSNYGGKLFARYMINENFFAYGEYEILNIEFVDIEQNGDYETTRRNVSSLLVGGGYQQQIGNNAYVNMMILYNLNESTYSPYSNPVIRIGFNIGL